MTTVQSKFTLVLLWRGKINVKPLYINVHRIDYIVQCVGA